MSSNSTLRNLAVTVSGSFHRHLHAINAAVEELAALSIRVLSPADPRVVAQQGEFLFVASDRVRSVRLVQDRHFESIRAASFLWLVCPDGYIGQSASSEVGFAIAAGVPIFSTHAPDDLTLREYISVVPSLKEAVQMITSAPPRQSEGLLIDPRASIEAAHHILERIEEKLSRGVGDEVAPSVHCDMAELRVKVNLPMYVQ
jgi:hypothetical protein